MTKKKRSIDLIAELDDYVKEINTELKVIPTGVPSLDVSTGILGIPLGKFVEIYGAEGVGKTTLAVTISNQFLKHDERNVLYCDVEQALSSKFVDMIIEQELRDRFIITQPGTLESALRVCEAAMASGSFSLVVLDSIGALTSQEVIDSDLEDKHVSILARYLTKFIQKNAMLVRQNNLTFLGINQVRDSIGGYVKAYSTPGGHAWKHILSLRIELSFATPIKRGEEKIGLNTSFVIKKNKLASPFKSFSFPIIFGKGIDTIRDLIIFSEMLGIIERRGSYYVFEDENLGLGLEKAIDSLMKKPVLDKLKERCYNSINLMNSSIVFEEGDDENEEISV